MLIDFIINYAIILVTNIVYLQMTLVLLVQTPPEGQLSFAK